MTYRNDFTSKRFGAARRRLKKLKQEEIVAVRAQMAGMTAGSSADVCSELFADIALCRMDYENQQGQINMALADSKAVQHTLEETRRVLSSPDVPRATKRNILLPLVDKVICQKDGAEVVFLPGLFGNAEEEAESTLHTTCMGMRTQR